MDPGRSACIADEPSRCTASEPPGILFHDHVLQRSPNVCVASCTKYERLKGQNHNMETLMHTRSRKAHATSQNGGMLHFHQHACR